MLYRLLKFVQSQISALAATVAQIWLGFIRRKVRICTEELDLGCVTINYLSVDKRTQRGTNKFAYQINLPNSE